MTRIPTLLSLAGLMVVPALSAEARPAKPVPGAAIKARQSAMADFDARMSRLDALVGAAPASRAARSRSAEAGR